MVTWPLAELIGALPLLYDSVSPAPTSFTFPLLKDNVSFSLSANVLPLLKESVLPLLNKSVLPLLKERVLPSCTIDALGLSALSQLSRYSYQPVTEVKPQRVQHHPLTY